MIFEENNECLYIQVYNYYKELITSGNLTSGSKLPSIRNCALQLGISRTTAESAYLFLAADGYILSKPQSGYYVTEFAQKKKSKIFKEEVSLKAPEIIYDFSASSIDLESFNLNLWRRYIKSALRQENRLLSYGEVQGEYELREAVCRYLSSHRNVVCKAKNIVVGAGFQSLLHILCPLIQDKKNIWLQDSKFLQGKAIFEDYGFHFSETSNSADILYMTPSHMNRLGDIMPVAERFTLLRQIQKENKFIIEDDFDSEFCYLNRPAPSIQGLDRGEHVIYLCTFSRLLLPSIRISFMILPESLLPLYQERKSLYNQTASKAEQIALCQFIRDGHLEAQIRKAQKFYTSKANKLMTQVKHILGKAIEVTTGDSGLIINVNLKKELKDSQFLLEAAANEQLRFKFYLDEQNHCHLLLSCFAISVNDFEDALHRLARVINQILS